MSCDSNALFPRHSCYSSESAIVSALLPAMKSHFLRLMNAQKGYTQLEEGKLSSESKDVYLPPPAFISRGLFDRTELAARVLCGLMFVGGAVMLLAAGYVRQSDRDCAAQLSMWCTFDNRSPDLKPLSRSVLIVNSFRQLLS